MKLNSKKNRKSQVVLEFLTSYGWVLIVLVVIGIIIFASGVINTEKAAPQDCFFSSQVNCVDYVVSTDVIKVKSQRRG